MTSRYQGSLFILCLLVTSVACSSQVPPDSDAFDFGRRVAELKDKTIGEASGLAASKANPGYFWTHNDSHNDAEVFLVDTSLNIVLTCTFSGLENRDWEDINVGPGPEEGKSYIYLGDIGDNLARYDQKYIYRFEEPLLDTAVKKKSIKKFDTITFRLPDERKDSEALLINPLTRDLYVISKREEPVHVYELKYPYSTTNVITARDVGTLPMTLVVAGDFSEDGNELLIRNYKNNFYWKNTVGKSFADIIKEKPKVVEYMKEPQGEAITWALDGSGFYTLSEKVSGKKSFLYFFKRK